MAQKPDLASVFKALDAHDLPFLSNMGQSTAHLLDENNPNGVVVLRDEKGNDRLYMPRSAYDEIRSQKP